MPFVPGYHGVLMSGDILFQLFLRVFFFFCQQQFQIRCRQSSPSPSPKFNGRQRSKNVRVRKRRFWRHDHLSNWLVKKTVLVPGWQRSWPKYDRETDAISPSVSHTFSGMVGNPRRILRFPHLSVWQEDAGVINGIAHVEAGFCAECNQIQMSFT